MKIEDLMLMKKNNRNETCLFTACYHGNLIIVKYLIEKGLNIHEKNTLGVTCFFNACYGGSLYVVKYLVEEKNININERDTDGKTCLITTLLGINKYIEVIEYLINRGIIIDDEVREYVKYTYNKDVLKLLPLFVLKN